MIVNVRSLGIVILGIVLYCWLDQKTLKKLYYVYVLLICFFFFCFFF